jgi:hypothetical protein
MFESCTKDVPRDYRLIQPAAKPFESCDWRAASEKKKQFRPWAIPPAPNLNIHSGCRFVFCDPPALEGQIDAVI